MVIDYVLKRNAKIADKLTIVFPFGKDLFLPPAPIHYLYQAPGYGILNGVEIASLLL